MNSGSLASQKICQTGLRDRAARGLLERQLHTLRGGQLTIMDEFGREQWGEASDMHATMTVRHPRFFAKALLGGTMAVGESYLRGEWDCDNLTNLFRIFIRNRSLLAGIDGGLTWITRWWHRVVHWLRANTPTGSQRNVGAHYDLGNEFFRLWLDETMAYSSGIFPSLDASLKAASEAKFDRICRKLALQTTDDVIEIGGGWGGFAIHAAQNYGCRITTTTISNEQFKVARKRIQQAGLDERICLLSEDYRCLTGQFDKLVSIEMVEAVGYRNLDTYFRHCGELLRPDGSLVLQAIVMPERGYRRYLRSVDFMQRYVFPGGCLPSLGAILKSVARTTDLRFVAADDFAPHYAETLRRWRRAFDFEIDEIRRLGYSKNFIRFWHYYLCYCEAAFEERYLGLLQIQFDKPKCRRDTWHNLGRSKSVEERNKSTTEGNTNNHELAACCGN